MIPTPNGHATPPRPAPGAPLSDVEKWIVSDALRGAEARLDRHLGLPHRRPPEPPTQPADLVGAPPATAPRPWWQTLELRLRAWHTRQRLVQLHGLRDELLEDREEIAKALRITAVQRAKAEAELRRLAVLLQD